MDWEGQRTQIDLAKKHGVKQVVLISRCALASSTALQRKLQVDAMQRKLVRSF